jgi:hypothetical protein
MNSENSFPVPAVQPSREIRLQVRGVGHIPGKKNRVFARADGGVMTDRQIRERLNRITNLLFTSLLRLATSGGTTLTMQSLRCLIASLPRDDNWKDIPVTSKRTIAVPKGEEGVDIVITLLP